MKKPLFEDALNHFAYGSALTNAKSRAMRDPEATLRVYYDGVAIFVRDKAAEPPRNSLKICDVRKDGDDVKIVSFEEKVTWTKITPQTPERP